MIKYSGLGRPLKVGLIAYHADAYRYPHTWIDRCVESIEAQTVGPDTLYEMDYGGGSQRFFEHYGVQCGSYDYQAKSLTNYAEAMNLLLDRAFDDECDVVFNTNIDDYYLDTRIESQLALADGADLVSSNFLVVDEKELPVRLNLFDTLDIASEFAAGHNIICHPSVMWTRRFWEGCSRYDPAEVPEEDFALWQRELPRHRFLIDPEILVCVRSHEHNAGKDPEFR